MTGAFNLLRQRYGSIAPGLVRVTAGANFLMTAFSVVYGSLSKPSVAQWVLILTLNAGVTILTFVRSAQSSGQQSTGVSA